VTLLLSHANSAAAAVPLHPVWRLAFGFRRSAPRSCAWLRPCRAAAIFARQPRSVLRMARQPLHHARPAAHLKTSQSCSVCRPAHLLNVVDRDTYDQEVQPAGSPSQRYTQTLSTRRSHVRDFGRSGRVSAGSPRLHCVSWTNFAPMQSARSGGRAVKGIPRDQSKLFGPASSHGINMLQRLAERSKPPR
jgi:hypothetical protein